MTISSDEAAPTALVDVAIGSTCVFVGSRSGSAATRRLGELGLRRGAQLTPVRRTSGGGRVVASGELRLAFDRATAAAIEVQTTAAARDSAPQGTRR